MIYHLANYSLSGIVSHIVLKNCFRNIELITCGYEKFGEKLDGIKINEKDKLIVSNFSLKNGQYNRLLEIDKNMIFIDHHYNSLNLEKRKNNFINIDFSSCLLVWKIFNKYIPEDKKLALKKLAYYANLYDKWKIEKNDFDIGYALNELFWKEGMDRFIENFKNGFRELTDKEKKFVNVILKDKHKRILKLKYRNMEEKNSLLFLLNGSDIDLVNDISITYRKWEIIFIFMKDKQKLYVKHKNENKNLSILFEEFKDREDIKVYNGDIKYGIIQYKKINDIILVKDLRDILDRM